METIYTIPAPNSLSASIDVYGDPNNGWYEWRVVNGGLVEKDTAEENTAFCQGRQYGQAEIALRDALMFCSGLPVPGMSLPSPLFTEGRPG